ncbi:uncharacterized protein JN550_004477 [Neoarthrinium moseri]|uniref:uncharacterized protein n=1 Tax=Neoarthrinium moseri TaxID=1658444 RepID=UPI001FDD3835|nr:uncharacterized protein JN550_004477 [Neoarthrinium moseri]KAI1871483.1 hypothetical protein JN550_004477 [Neoarthrinium moseri]
MPPRCANPHSAARLFVQLSAASRQGSILDVLLPPQTRSFRGSAMTIATSPTTPRHIQSRVARVRNARAIAPRSFSTTALRQKTLAIHNPQVDEDGTEMVLEITPRAANRLTKIMTKDSNPHLALRVQVEAGGCHGFQYLMSLVTLPSSVSASKSTTPVPGNPSSPPEIAIPNPPSPDAEAELAPSTTSTTTPAKPELRDDDTVFAFIKDDVSPEDDGGRALATGPKIVLDTPSLDLLKGSKLDFTMELIGSQFKIVDNPAASSSCGCGTSFDIKL